MPVVDDMDRKSVWGWAACLLCRDVTPVGGKPSAAADSSIEAACARCPWRCAAYTFEEPWCVVGLWAARAA